VAEENLWVKILYKKVYKGAVEKDGKTYKKYKNVPRFPFLHNHLVRNILFVLCAGLVLYVFIKINWS